MARCATSSSLDDNANLARVLHQIGNTQYIMGDYDDLGVAYLHQDGSAYGDYWTQVFGRQGE